MNKQKIIFLLTDRGVEIWRDIYGWEGLYQISNFARVRTHKGKYRYTNHTNNSGYLMMTFKNSHSPNKPQNKSIHRMVARAFLLNFREELDVCHIDDNKLNNIVTNLKMDTHINNCNEGNRNQKLREINLGRTGDLNPKSKKVYCEELDMVFVNITYAQKYMKEVLGRGSNVGKCCRGVSKTAGGYHWRFVED